METTGIFLILIGLLASICRMDSCKFGENCDYPCHCQNNEVCNPTDGSCASGCDDGDLREPGDYWYTGAWSGYGCQIGNVAYNKIANRSDKRYDAGLAVDGNLSPYFSECTHPNYVRRYGNWWRVDLGATYVVLTINITNVRSGNCCQDRMNYMDIYVTERVNAATSDRICYSVHDEGAVDSLHINCAQPMRGRYVKLQKHDVFTTLMNICEVQVYGYPYRDCPNDYYGVACGKACNCSDVPCDDVTGECRSQNNMDISVADNVDNVSAMPTIAGVAAAVILIMILAIVLVILLRRHFKPGNVDSVYLNDVDHSSRAAGHDNTEARGYQQDTYEDVDVAEQNTSNMEYEHQNLGTGIHLEKPFVNIVDSAA